MNQNHKQRIYQVSGLLVLLAIVGALVLNALSSNINLFYTPTELSKQTLPPQTTVRVGGMVVKESVLRGENLAVSFTITDFEEQLNIDYQGILPDLFREGQGVVIQGHLVEPHRFQAKQILAKHDEKYMPPELKSIPMSTI